MARPTAIFSPQNPHRGMPPCERGTFFGTPGADCEPLVSVTVSESDMISDPPRGEAVLDESAQCHHGHAQQSQNERAGEDRRRIETLGTDQDDLAEARGAQEELG